MPPRSRRRKAARTKLSPRLVAQARRDIGSGGVTIDDYAKRLNVSWSTVEKAVYGHTWRSVTDPPPLSPPPAPPEEEPTPAFARLTGPVVAEMRRQYRAGHASFAELARRHGVGEATVRNAVLGYSWRRVNEPPVKPADVGGWTVVSEAQEAEIVRRREVGEAFRAIAAALGHDVAVVHRAYRRLRPSEPRRRAGAPAFRRGVSERDPS